MSPLLLCNKVAFTSSQSARIIMLYHCGFVSGSRCVNVINFLPEIWQNRRWDSVHDLPVYKYLGPDHPPYWKATLCEACKDAFHVSDVIQLGRHSCPWLLPALVWPHLPTGLQVLAGHILGWTAVRSVWQGWQLVLAGLGACGIVSVALAGAQWDQSYLFLLPLWLSSLGGCWDKGNRCRPAH